MNKYKKYLDARITMLLFVSTESSESRWRYASRLYKDCIIISAQSYPEQFENTIDISGQVH